MGCYSLGTHGSVGFVLRVFIPISSSQPHWVAQMRDLTTERFNDARFID